MKLLVSLNEINDNNINKKDINQLQNHKQLLMNKFIKKFPKVKLETILDINKYLNENNLYLIDNNNNNINIIINNYINRC